MIEELFAWFHRKRTGHTQTRRKVTIGLGDTSKGILIRCECGNVWAV